MLAAAPENTPASVLPIGLFETPMFPRADIDMDIPDAGLPSGKQRRNNRSGSRFGILALSRLSQTFAVHHGRHGVDVNSREQVPIRGTVPGVLQRGWDLSTLARSPGSWRPQLLQVVVLVGPGGVGRQGFHGETCAVRKGTRQGW